MKNFKSKLTRATTIGRSGYRRGVQTPEFIGMAWTVGFSQFARFTKGDRGLRRAVEAGVASSLATVVAFGLVNAVAVVVFNRDEFSDKAFNDEAEYYEQEDDK